MTKPLALQLILPVRKDNGSADKAAEAEKYYSARGFDVFNPLDMPKILSDLATPTEPRIQAACLYHLAFTDLAVVMPGWATSEGCINEIAFATTHGIPLYFYKSNIRVFFDANIIVKIESQAPGDIITPDVLYDGKEAES